MFDNVWFCISQNTFTDGLATETAVIKLLQVASFLGFFATSLCSQFYFKLKLLVNSFVSQSAVMGDSVSVSSMIYKHAFSALTPHPSRSIANARELLVSFGLASQSEQPSTDNSRAVVRTFIVLVECDLFVVGSSTQLLCSFRFSCGACSQITFTHSSPEINVTCK